MNEVGVATGGVFDGRGEGGDRFARAMAKAMRGETVGPRAAGAAADEGGADDDGVEVDPRNIEAAARAAAAPARRVR
jgi:hypothetical protein